MPEAGCVNRLTPFLLEDFFYEFEHRSDLFNLASSDAWPWKQAEIAKKVGWTRDSSDFGYPDVSHLIIPRLTAACELPDGFSVLPTAGAAEAIAVTIHELAASGNFKSIGIPVPGYGAFVGLAKLLGLEIFRYTYQQEHHWELNESELMDAAQTCDAIVLINPHNPTGSRAGDAMISTLATCLATRRKLLLIDEVFRTSSEDSLLKQAVGSQCDVVAFGSFSKTYGLPGLRFGWAVANEARISRMRTIQQYLTLSISSGSAGLASRILDDPDAFSRATLITHNRQLLLDWAVGNRNRVHLSTPQGGTTVIVEFDVAANEHQLFRQFLNAGVLLVPGSRFGAPADRAWFRLGYGSETNKLEEGLRRLADTVTDP